MAALEDADNPDPEKLKHANKTLRGMHQAVLKAKEAARQTHTKAVDLANQWKAEHDRVAAELEQVRKGATAPAASQPSPTADSVGAQAAKADEYLT